MKTKIIICLAGVLAGITACGSGSSSDAGTTGGDAGPCATQQVSGGSTLKSFCPPGSPTNGSVLFDVSGEALALDGYPFPPTDPNSVAFVDGWEVRYQHAIVTFDHVTLSANSDKVPTDQSMTDDVVAEIDGPWAADLHLGGSQLGKGGPLERAAPFAILTSENKKANAAFDLTQRYAFGFEAVKATADAMNINLDEDGIGIYQDMIAKGETVRLIGTATFKGGSTCTSSVASYDFTKLPAVVNFSFGLSIPTKYVNCQNPDNDPATAFAGEEHQRGISLKANTFTIAQVTFHLDHGYWESVVHDSPAHFDQFASRKVGATGVPTVTYQDLVGVDFTAFKDSAGNDLPWRSCLSTYHSPGHGTMGFDPQTVPVNPHTQPGQALRDFADYFAYNLSTYGHLNSDGLCYVARNYPSPR